MINRNLAKVLSKRYIILAITLIILAGGLLVLPSYEKNESITVENLLDKVINPERYISADELADKIINNDPSILLVDLRTNQEFDAYTIPSAINIPFEKIIDSDYEGYLDQDEYEVVLFSNEDLIPDQAWLLLTRAGYKNLHVLQGGINGWHNTILNPPKPEEGMPNEAFILHDFRLAAAQHFGVTKHIPVETVVEPVKKKVIKKVVVLKKKKKKKLPEGGC